MVYVPISSSAGPAEYDEDRITATLEQLSTAFEIQAPEFDIRTNPRFVPTPSEPIYDVMQNGVRCHPEQRLRDAARRVDRQLDQKQNNNTIVAAFPADGLSICEPVAGIAWGTHMALTPESANSAPVTAHEMLHTMGMSHIQKTSCEPNSTTEVDKLAGAFLSAPNDECGLLAVGDTESVDYYTTDDSVIGSNLTDLIPDTLKREDLPISTIELHALLPEVYPTLEVSAVQPGIYPMNYGSDEPSAVAIPISGFGSLDERIDQLVVTVEPDTAGIPEAPSEVRCDVPEAGSNSWRCWPRLYAQSRDEARSKGPRVEIGEWVDSPVIYHPEGQVYGSVLHIYEEQGQRMVLLFWSSFSDGRYAVEVARFEDVAAPGGDDILVPPPNYLTE
jgi:hypothetical protein